MSRDVLHLDEATLVIEDQSVHAVFPIYVLQCWVLSFVLEVCEPPSHVKASLHKHLAKNNWIPATI